VREEVLNGHVSIDRCSNYYGFSLLHRSRRVHSHQVSQVNRVFAGGFGLGSASRYDSALSPALRGYRFLILKGDSARVATKSRLPPPGLLAQGFDREVAEIEEEFFQGGAKE
jgi:hypothetical protein